MYFNAVRDCKRCHTEGEEFQPSKPPDVWGASLCIILTVAPRNSC